MLDYIEEEGIFKKGYNYLAALDEAGRGPLAGPVVAACVLVTPSFKVNSQKLSDIKDSKRLTEKKREALFQCIYEEFPAVGVGICDHSTVDRINVLQASFLAMKKAISAIKPKPDFVMLDGGLPLANFSITQKYIIKGDDSVFSIAAASIIAKVVRDRLMKTYHQQYPQYGFDQHKGYGTKDHLEMLSKYGPSPIHRKTFAPVKNLLVSRRDNL